METFRRTRLSRVRISRGPNIEQSYYDIADERFLNRPLAPYPLAAWADFTYDGVPIRIGQYVQTVKRITGRELYSSRWPWRPAISVGDCASRRDCAAERENVSGDGGRSQQREGTGKRTGASAVAGRAGKRSRSSVTVRRPRTTVRISLHVSRSHRGSSRRSRTRSPQSPSTEGGGTRRGMR